MMIDALGILRINSLAKYWSSFGALLILGSKRDGLGQLSFKIDTHKLLSGSTPNGQTRPYKQTITHFFFLSLVCWPA